jgi:hypothetical protein
VGAGRRGFSGFRETAGNLGADTASPEVTAAPAPSPQAAPDATRPRSRPLMATPRQAGSEATRPNMMIRVVTKIGINHGVLALKRPGVTRRRQDLQLKLRATPYPPWLSSAPHPRPKRPPTLRTHAAGRCNAHGLHGFSPSFAFFSHLIKAN